MTIHFHFLHPRMTVEALGFLPDMLDENDPRPAREQLNDNYRHGGGWDPFPGFELNEDNSITYPGDPTLKPLAKAKLRDETILFYPFSGVMIQQPDRSFEICRMD
jgi:hypothetical protein